MHFLHKSITKDIPKNSFVNAFCSRVIVRMMGLGRSAEGRRLSVRVVRHWKLSETDSFTSHFTFLWYFPFFRMTLFFLYSKEFCASVLNINFTVAWNSSYCKTQTVKLKQVLSESFIKYIVQFSLRLCRCRFTVFLLFLVFSKINIFNCISIILWCAIEDELCIILRIFTVPSFKE